MRPRQSTGTVSTLGSSPSLLNGTGDSNLVTGDSARASASLQRPPSASLSRRSSASAINNTDTTDFEDVGDESADRGRPHSQATGTDSPRNSTGKDNKGNVLVSVRVRPDAAAGDASGSEGEWMVDGRRSLIQYTGREGGDYRYDNVFSPHDRNNRVYDSAAKRLVRRVMEGYHGTVFAYGMTGTGKTFSMQGTAGSPGVIPLAITDIFSYIRENPNREFLLRVSYLEIYNEKIHDLLSQSTPGQPQEQEIKLREDSKRGVYATPLKEEIVQSPNQLLRVIARGDIARRTSSTQYNARSSRSHAVVQIVVESRERTAATSHRSDNLLPGGVLVSTLSLIDLAGSERAAENKERRTEGAHINKSLLTLGTVIARLSGEDEKEDGTKSTEKDKERSVKHLPYRDSKLTRLLQPALSGDSLVSILCTVQLSSAGTSAATVGQHTGETLNTLKFASRAKNNIVSHAKRNESNPNGVDAGSRALLDRYRIEIQDLRNQLEQQNKAKEETETQEEIEQDRKREEEMEREDRDRHEEQMLEMQLARTALKERISHLNRLILSSKSLGVNSNAGRLSSMSMPVNVRGSTQSNGEFGRPVSVRSRESMNSSRSPHNRDSNATIDASARNSHNISRHVSVGMTMPGVLPAAPISQLAEDSALEEEETQEQAEADGESEATLAQQNRMLQEDLEKKTHYIATLEKRLLQARRTSHSRASMQPASRMSQHEDNDQKQLLRDKDHEIEELRAKLDDQTRMVNALRSATRKRDTLESHKSITSNDSARPASIEPSSPRNSSRNSTRSLMRLQLASSRLSNGHVHGHRSNPSTTSRSGSTIIKFSNTPLSPIALLSPSASEKSSADDLLLLNRSPTGSPSSSSKTFRRRSVDEMTLLLDQMIQEKVEKGEVMRSERGTLRVKRDMVTGRAGGDVVGGAAGGVAVEERILEEEEGKE